MNSVSHEFAWYVKRLQVMGTSEIVYRLRERITVKSLQLQHRMTSSLPRTTFTIQDINRFQFCTDSGQQLPHLPWSFEVDDHQAAALLDGQLSVLGHPWKWRSNPEVWHQAPDSNRTWPRIFFDHIPYREGNPYGDLRVVWEPSRLQHLVTLALIAQQAEPEARRRAVTTVEAQLLSWVQANPYLTGVHYISVMECALRIIALCHTLDLIRPWLTVGAQVWPALLNLVSTHAELIRKRISRHSSRGNHTVAEAVGLIYGGILFPEMAGAKRWLNIGVTLLKEEASHQIRQDGGNREETLWYLQFVCDLYGLATALLRQSQTAIPFEIEQAFERSRSFLQEFMSPHDRSLPSIGDSDGGHALSSFLHFIPKPKHESSCLTSFPHSGYSIIRGEETQRIIFDHGSLGMAPCHAHGHADALSVLFTLGQEDILIDPGNYCYTGKPNWRRYFRGTSAHNTVTVDGLDQAIQETTFMWSHPFHTELLHGHQSPDGTITLLARHTGYVDRLGVVHVRGIVYYPSGSWLVWDQLTGTGVHQLELNWHLGFEPRCVNGAYMLSACNQSLQLSIEGGIPSLHYGEEDPVRGWRSRLYGNKEAIHTLRIAYQGTLPHEFVTRVWHGGGAMPPCLDTIPFGGA